jgi:glucose dehydrogenase
VETPEARYGKTGARLSPSPVGAHHWPPMAYNPRTGLVYFPGQETTSNFQTVDTFEFKHGQWNTGTRLGQSPGRRGFLVAWDPVAQKERWRNDFNPSGGVLSTGGNLIFVGDGGGTFKALDPATGATLWQHQLLPGIATPVTYELDGTQYVVVMSGSSNGRVFAFALDATGGKPERWLAFPATGPIGRRVR